MERSAINVVYVLAMVATVVAVDIFVFRNHFWERLMSNAGIILVYVAFYLRFLNH